MIKQSKSQIELEWRKRGEMKHRIGKAKFIQEWKRTGCVNCGEKDVIVLDVAHIERSSKHIHLKGQTNGHKSLFHLSWPDLYAELPKCKVLCANCHRRETYEENLHLKDAF